MSKQKRQAKQEAREQEAQRAAARRKRKKEHQREQEMKASKALHDARFRKSRKKGLNKEQKKAYRKHKAVINRQKKDRQKQFEALLQERATKAKTAVKNVNASTTFEWIHLPEHLNNLVECRQIEKRHRKHLPEAIKFAKRRGYVLAGLMSVKRDTPLYDELGEIKEFEDQQVLWHGTKLGNLHGILSKGFKLPMHSGMLGKGIYAAPKFAKAWNYTGWGWGWNRQPSLRLKPLLSKRSDTKAVLLCDFRLGTVVRTTTSGEGAHQQVITLNGHTAFSGRGKTKYAWAGWIRHSEYCVYDPIQAKPQLLLIFEK